MKIYSFMGLLGVLASGAHADVASVRRDVARIDRALPSLSRRTRSRSDLALEGASVTVWGKTAARCKIVAHIFGETGRKTDTIYLSGGAPLFRYTDAEFYNGPLSASVKVGRRVQTRVYFQNGHPFALRVESRPASLSAVRTSRLERDAREAVRLSAARKSQLERDTREVVRLYLAREADASNR